jgi:glutathione synthase/RimK-type ligase-like ATP-grasp enzyme
VNPPHILLMGIATDPHLSAVGDALHQKGLASTIINSRILGHEPISPSSLSNTPGIWNAIWVRYLPPLFPKPGAALSVLGIQKQRAIRSFILQWLKRQSMAGVSVFPRSNEGTYDQFKISDLQLAKSANLNTPITACVSHLQAAQEFIEHQNADLIVKPIIGGQYAEALSQIDLAQWFQDYGPLILQEYIKGPSCRVLFFKGIGMSAFISSDHHEVDWRAATQESSPPMSWFPLQLPDTLTDKLSHFFNLSQLEIASIDMIMSDDQFYFLEANTTPSWLDLPVPFAHKITQHMAQFLYQAAKD